jgi:hypothetical protein
VSTSRRRKSAPPEADRQSVLERGAQTIGEQWARGWRDELHSTNRRVAGGWPGTMTEARARARSHLGATLSRQRLGELSVTELEQAARATYARARATWLSFADTNDTFEGGA